MMWNSASGELPTMTVEKSNSPTYKTMPPGCEGASTRIELSTNFAEILVRSLGTTDSKACSAHGE